jgi:hypothetical protein
VRNGISVRMSDEMNSIRHFDAAEEHAPAGCEAM